MFDAMNATIAALHRSTPAAVGLETFGRPGNYLARQIDRWSKQYRASETEPFEAMDRLIDWLPQRIPPARRDAHRARRLPHRQPALPSDRAARRRGARLGALDARRPAGRLRLSRDVVAHRPRHCSAGSAGSIWRRSGSRPRTRTSPRTADAPGASASRRGSTTWSTACFVSRRSCRACSSARFRGTQPASAARSRAARPGDRRAGLEARAAVDRPEHADRRRERAPHPRRARDADGRRCCAATGTRSPRSREMDDRWTKRVRLLGEDLVLFKDRSGTLRADRRVLPAPARLARLRDPDRRRDPLPVSRLEVRRHRPLPRAAERTRRHRASKTRSRPPAIRSTSSAGCCGPISGRCPRR